MHAGSGIWWPFAGEHDSELVPDGVGDCHGPDGFGQWPLRDFQHAHLRWTSARRTRTLQKPSHSIGITPPRDAAHPLVSDRIHVMNIGRFVESGEMSSGVSAEP